MGEFFEVYRTGFQHILHIESVEHINFVVALAAVFLLKDWKKALILAGAFAIGHSITLWMEAFRVVRFKMDLVLFLIPVSVMLTSFLNLFKRPYSIVNSNLQANYFIAFIFGMVHGVALGNYLRQQVSTIQIADVVAFNIGLEMGVVIIIAIYLFTTFLFVNIFGIARRDWILIISSALIGINYMIMLENKIW